MGATLKLMWVDERGDESEWPCKSFRHEFQVYRSDKALSAGEILETVGEMAIAFLDKNRIILSHFADVKERLKSLHIVVGLG